MTASPGHAWFHTGVRGGVVALLVLAAMRADGQALRTASAPVVDAAAPTQTLYLQLVTNDIATDRVARVVQHEGHLWISPEDLRAVSIPVGPSGEFIAIDTMAGITVEYDVDTQRLYLGVPAQWLPHQHVDAHARQQFMSATTSLGMLFNYDVQTATSNAGSRSFSVLGEQRLFDRWGVMSNIGLYRQADHLDNLRDESGYVRHSTSWSYSNEQTLRTVTAGDVVTGSLAWTRPVRLGGFSIERNFSIRPDLITYPLPDFSGEAAVPTSLDLFINGRKSTSAVVVPGPFTIDTAPSISGAGRATIVTTDALGRKVSREIPFYIANSLLKKGLAEYSLSGGFVRRGFGLSSFGYGRPAASGVGRVGVSDKLTLALHAEASRKVAVAGGGADVAVLHHGVLSVGSLTSRHEAGFGHEYSAGYSYTNSRISVNARRVERTAGFNDVARVESVDPGDPYRRLEQLTVGAPIGNHGTVGAGLIRQIREVGARSNLLSVSFSRRIPFGGNLFVAMNQALASESGRSLTVQSIFRFGERDTISTGATHNQQGGTSPYVQYSRIAPSSGGLEMAAGYSVGQADALQTDLSWRGQRATVTAGLRSQDGLSTWAGISGSGVLMNGRMFLTNRIHDAFVLVDTDGIADVPIRFENQIIGKTNRKGHLFVPSVASHYASRYELDPLGLDADLELPYVEQRVSVRRQSGAVIRFPVARIRAASVLLVDAEGTRLPFGLMVRHLESSQPAVIGWDGLAYLDHLGDSNTVRVSKADGTTCTASFDFPRDGIDLTTLGPVVCR